MRSSRHSMYAATAALLICGACCFYSGFQLALATGDSTAQSWVDKGLEVSKTHPNSDEEAACYRHAIEADPKHASAHFNLAFVLDSQVQVKWQGASTAWADLDKLYEALGYYASAASLNPSRKEAYENVVRITTILLETPTQRPPDLQTLLTRLYTCQEAAGTVTRNEEIQSICRGKIGRLLPSLEKRLADLKDTRPSDKLVSATEISRALTRHFTRGQSPYQGPRIPLMIQFDHDKDTIRPDSAAQLHEVAEALKGRDLANSVILIEGHTDIKGTSEHNDILSRNRADSVKRYLMEKFGIPEGRFKTKGYGKAHPLVPNDTEAHLAMNRRVEFVNDGELAAFQEQAKHRSRSGSVDLYDLLYWE